MSASVLILSDEAEFARSLVARWQSERMVPAFTVMGLKSWQPAPERSMSGIAVVSGELGACRAVLKGLEQAHVAAVFVTAGKDVHSARQQFQRTAVLKRSDEWLDALVLLAAEMLRRIAVAEHAAEAEKRAKLAENHAVLGTYMLEMRHALNNALTSVLGNAELLLLEPGTLAGEARDQVDTIHNMAMRIHEVLQRFSSLEAEMRFSEEGDGHKSMVGRSAASGG